jgi:hypothetical protein
MGESQRQDAATFSIEERDTHIVVRQHRIVGSPFEAEYMLGGLSGSLERLGLAKAVLDLRGLPQVDDDLRDALWEWARGAGKRVVLALIVDGELARMRSNMSALSSGLQLRAFAVEALAEAWLFATPAQRPTAEIPPIE